MCDCGGKLFHCPLCTGSADSINLMQAALYVCQALPHIHSCEYLHGDIKSDNILLVREGLSLIPKTRRPLWR